MKEMKPKYEDYVRAEQARIDAELDAQKDAEFAKYETVLTDNVEFEALKEKKADMTVKEIESEGIIVMDQTELIKPLLPKPGVLTKRQPTPEELADMEFGFKMAKAIGGLDIGQTVVVKNRAVMAVEAIEGTDACILRGGFLGKGGVIVAKTAKPSQDQRFDIPGFGTKTMESMIHAGATGIVIEAGNTLVVDREKTIAMADAHNITILVK